MSELHGRLRTAVAAGDEIARVGATATVTGPRSRWSAERMFFLGFAAAIATAVVVGFSRTFFLRPWFAEWARANSPTETIFYVHGVVFAAWFLLLLTQPVLVGAGRVDLHRRLGLLGGSLAVAMLLIGTVGSLIAAGRPTGFTNVPMPPLQFLVIPLADLVLFGAFVTLALVNRNRPQSHKRYMLLGSIALIAAAIARWPVSGMLAPSPVPGFSTLDLFVDLFLVPMVVWDVATRGRVHPVTLWGGMAMIAVQPLRMLLSGTSAWLAFAGWAVTLVR